MDLPGAMVIPKVSLRTMYGLGSGDVSAHAGTALLTASAGAGGRYYLSDRFTLSLQTDATVGWANFGTSAPNYALFLFTATPRISSAVSPHKTNGFYGGIQANVIGVLDRVVEHSPSADEGILTDRRTFYSEGVAAGIFIGLDRLKPDSGEGFQIEAMLTPFHFSDFTSAPIIAEDDFPILFQISMSFYGRR